MYNLYRIRTLYKHYTHNLKRPNIQSCTQIIRPLVRFYSYDYDLHKTNYIFK